MKNERMMVYYLGRVQGVGFRFNACALAAKRKLVGYVQNEHDGSVYLVAEGPKKELEGLLCDIRGSRLGGNIKQAQVDWADAKGGLATFVINYT